MLIRFLRSNCHTNGAFDDEQIDDQRSNKIVAILAILNSFNMHRFLPTNSTTAVYHRARKSIRPVYIHILEVWIYICIRARITDTSYVAGS